MVPWCSEGEGDRQGCEHDRAANANPNDSQTSRSGVHAGSFADTFLGNRRKCR